MSSYLALIEKYILKNVFREQAGMYVVYHFKIPASQIKVFRLDSWLFSKFHFPANVDPGKQQVMFQQIGCL